MRALEAQAALLSVPPVFDEAIGRDLLAGAAGWPDATPKDHADPLQALRLAGLLTDWQGLLRIVDPLREQLRRKLAVDEPERFRVAASTFSAHARNGSRDSLKRALGEQPTAVSAAVFDVIAQPHLSEVSDRLVDVLQEVQLSGRQADTAAAARQLRSVPESSPHMSRLVYFLRGLDEWRVGNRASAAAMFGEVVGRAADRPEAIAGHLLGVARAADGEYQSALGLLQASASLLRAQRDNRGLAQVLTTIGRVTRQTAIASGAEADSEVLGTAAKALEEAVALGAEVDDIAIEGLALIELARVVQTEGQLEIAAELAERAVSLLHGDERLGAYVVLGGVLRDAGRDAEAGEALGHAAQLARETGRTDLSLARLLNVQASADRRAGRRGDALRHARESVDLGRTIGDRRHVAHALHTLAAILLDLREPDAVAEATHALEQSVSILTALGDDRGVGMVRRTQARLPEPEAR